jgi:hypothetical protein
MLEGSTCKGKKVENENEECDRGPCGSHASIEREDPDNYDLIMKKATVGIVSVVAKKSRSGRHKFNNKSYKRRGKGRKRRRRRRRPNRRRG